MKRRWFNQDDFWLVFKYLILVSVIAIIIRGFLLIPIQVEGNSMRSTLRQNDWVLVEKLSPIKRFDIVVFQMPDGSTYVKRVVGLPGERIQYQDNQLFVNGQKVSETFLDHNRKKIGMDKLYTNNFSLDDLLNVQKLGKESYFVMGDNRRQSKDSRSFGAITANQIIGKARFVYYPIKHTKYIH